MTGDEASALPVDPVDPLARELAEDSGAGTQDRFRWQHHCAAADAIRMLVDEDIVRVVCEVHEDYVIEHTVGFELVSCKHREAARGPWKLVELCRTGGVAHLFGRWQELGDVRVKLMTNAGLAPGDGEAAAAMGACVKVQEGLNPEDFAAERDALARALLAAGRSKKYTGIPQTPAPKRNQEDEIPADFRQSVATFMLILSVKSELPPRQMIETVHAHEVMRPALGHTGIADVDPVNTYRAIVEAVAERNRVDGLTGRYAYWFWGEAIEGQRGTLAALVSARSIYRRDLMRICTTSRVERPPVLRPRASDHARLNAKLVAGRVGPIRRREATRLREAWLAEWFESRSGLPGDASVLYDLETRILGVAGDAEAVARLPGDSNWGDRLFGELKARLTPDVATSFPVASRELLLGAAFDLAAQCHIWFSDEFDVDEALREVAEGGLRDG